MFLFLFWQNLKDYGDDEIPCCIWGERQDYKSTGVFLWAYVQLDYFSTLDKTHKNSSLFELLTVKKLPLISYSVTSTVFISTTKITGCEQMRQIWIKRLKWDDTIATEIELVFLLWCESFAR